MVGGTGHDLYVVDNVGDVVVENANEGRDMVYSSISYTLGNNVEDLLLIGNAAINGTGNALDNHLEGNSANNVLSGGAGNDTLFGSWGKDTLIGGTGDDVYLILEAAGDVIVENANEGTDTVQSTVSYTLSDNIENLMLVSDGAINGTGNAQDNTISGNAAANILDGGAGNDVIYTGTGNDIVYGGLGDDVINDDGNARSDNDTIYGGAGNDTINTTLAWEMNWFNGGVGNDTLSYNLIDYGNNSQNGVWVDLSQGTASRYGLGRYNDAADTLLSIENVTGSSLRDILIGDAGANRLVGLGGDDTIRGGVGDDTLDGGNGNDSLDGGEGADLMLGGAGDDTYEVDSVGDVVSERANEGADTVQSYINYSLDSGIAASGGIVDTDYIRVKVSNYGYTVGNVENLTLMGNGNLTGWGNSGNNTLTGNAGSNVLNGGAGVDTLYGGAGNDTLNGGSDADVMDGGVGDDTYVVDNIYDRVVENANAGTDTVLSSISYALAFSNIENLVLTGTDAINGQGNVLNNKISGNSASNFLFGDTGLDTLMGGAGDDTYLIDDAAGDVVIELANEGTDTVQSSFSYTLTDNVENLMLVRASAINGTGNALNNTITGNTAANILDGGAGNDTINAGEGDDTVRGGVGNDVIDAYDGFDLIYGDDGNDTIYGGAGGDTIFGGAGVDSMVGGTGNDIYVVDNVGDVVVENANEGRDMVHSYISYTLGDNVEDLLLIGDAAINGTGNALDNMLEGNSANNVLTGGAGNDRLFGSWGQDTLIGGTGNDTYLIDSTQDFVQETANQGLDTVRLMSGLNLNLSAVLAQFSSVECFDLASETAANKFVASVQTVTKLSDTNIANLLNGWTNSTGSALTNSVNKHQMIVDGTSKDSVDVTGWGAQVGTAAHLGTNYLVYQQGEAQLFINKQMIVL